MDTVLRLAPLRRPSSQREPLATGRSVAASVAGTHITPAVRVDVKRLRPPFDDLAIDHDLADADETRQFEHRVEQDCLHNRAEPARSGLAENSSVGDRL